MINLEYGDFIMLVNGKVKMISSKTSVFNIRLETAQRLLERGYVMEIQVEEDGEEYFVPVEELK